MPADKVRIVNLDGDALAMRCKSWACPDCRPWLKRRLRQSIVAATEERPQLRRFFTLTMAPGARQLELRERYRELHRSFGSLCKRIQRREGKRMAYLQVREGHQDGTPHIHGLMDAFRRQNQLLRDWRAVGGGSVNVRFVDPQRVAAYISKYLAKDDQVLPRGCRKYGSGGGVRLHGVRPPGGGGAWRPQVHGRGHRGEPRWLDVNGGEFGVALGQMTHVAVSAQLAQRVAQRELERELQHVAAGLDVCVICGGDHQLHGVV